MNSRLSSTTCQTVEGALPGPVDMRPVRDVTGVASVESHTATSWLAAEKIAPMAGLTGSETGSDGPLPADSLHGYRHPGPCPDRGAIKMTERNRRNRLTDVEKASLTPEQKKSRLEHIRDSACPSSPHGGHGDPDNSGMCIYCGAILDIDAFDY